MIIDALDATVRGNPGERYAGRTAAEELSDRSQIGPLATRARQLKSLLAEPRSAGAPEAGRVVGAAVRLSDALPAETRTWAPDSPAFRFAHECHGVRSTTGPVGEFLIPGRLTPGPAAAEVVRSAEDLATVCTAIATVPAWNWSAATAMTILLLRAHEREPVAQLLG